MKLAIKQDGKINQRLIYPAGTQLVPVREFHIWFRIDDEKDSIAYYSDKENILDAIQDANRRIRGNFAIEYNGKTVMKYGELVPENIPQE